MFSTLHHHAPLARYTSLRRSPLRRISRRHRAAQAQWRRITAQRRELAGGRCEVAIPWVCGGSIFDGHHVRRRSQGGRNVLENCLYVCRRCHRFLHRHVEASYLAGWLVRGCVKGGEQ